MSGQGTEVSSLGLSPLTPPATFLNVIVPLEENKKNFTPLWNRAGSSECSRVVPVAVLEGGFGLGWVGLEVKQRWWCWDLQIQHSPVTAPLCLPQSKDVYPACGDHLIGNHIPRAPVMLVCLPALPTSPRALTTSEAPRRAQD